MALPISGLFRNLLIYGAGDAATSLVSLLLLPLFTRYLTPEDYGVIAMLLGIEALTKVTMRWGIDTAFMRLYYDCRDQAARQRLASTILFFLVAVNSALLGVALTASAWLSGHLFGVPTYGVLISLAIANTFVAGFHFIPYHVLRIDGRSMQFIALAFSRSAATLLLRLGLVIWAGLGVLGLVIADIVVTTGFTLLLVRFFAPLIRPVFSVAILRDALRFGLPRVPHSLASQVIGFADRYFLNAFAKLSDVGLYSIGASFGLALKLFLSAFEAAWTPFFLGVMHEPNAGAIYRLTATYILAVLVLLVAGLSAVAPELVRLFTTAGFHQAASVTPWIAVGVLFQGTYIVGSIGLVITKRTTFYPVATGTAALVSVVANLVLIPRFGYLGAAWANAVAYATLAGLTVTFSQRVYPIEYEWSRLARIALAGGGAYAAGASLPLADWPPLAALVARGTLVVAIYVGTLAIVRFFHAGEVGAIAEIRRRVLQQKARQIPIREPVEVEMGGEIGSSAPEPPDAGLDRDPAGPPDPTVSADSRSRRR